MSLDQRLRQASTELRGAVSGRRHRAIVHPRQRRGARVVVAAGAAVVVVLTVGIAAFAFQSKVESPRVMASPQASSTTPPATTLPPTTSQPVTEDPAALGDGLSGRWPGAERWLDELGDDGVPLLMEDGIGVALVSESNPDIGTTTALRITTEGHLHTELAPVPDAWIGNSVTIGFAIDYHDPTVKVFGTAPLGTTQVDVDLGGVTAVTIDRVFDRPEIDRAVFIGSHDRAALPGSIADPVSLSAVDADGRTTTFAMETWAPSSADIRDTRFELLLLDEQRPLVDGSVTIDRLPTIVTCQAPDGVEVPPNRGGSVTDGRVEATPEAALKSFVIAGVDGPVLATSGYVELTGAGDGDTVVYGRRFEGGDGYVALITVTRTDEGWTVERWQASGC